MPCVVLQETETAPFAGCGNVKRYRPGPVTLIPDAGTPLINRSPVFTLATGSLKDTSICVNCRTPAPATGVRVATVGVTWSMRLYCHVEAACVSSKRVGGISKSTMAWAASQET